MTDLTKMSEKELAKLKKDIDKEMDRRGKAKVADARKAAEQAVAKFGVSLSDVMGTKSAGKKSAAPAKYRNPDDASQTWSGRGRQPAWYKAAIEKGKKPEDLGN